MEQRTAEWHAARLGKVTASRIADLMARTRSGWGASRANYAAALVAERLTGTPENTYQNAAMLWGIETEPQARTAYEFLSDAEVELVGFIDHPSVPMSGASPDGLVGSAGMVEIKCPNTATHIDTLLEETIPDKYMKQMQWQMACAGRKWCDWVSYDPRLPLQMQLYVKRVNRDDKLIADIEKHVRQFLDEIEDTVNRLQQKYREAA